MLYFLFFCSGLSGLIYQVVWVRVFGNVFGNTVYSASIVVAVFMLGLGVGSYVIGAWADRRYATGPESLLRTYGYVEVVIATMGLGISLLLPHLDRVAALTSSYTREENGWYVVSTFSYLARGGMAIVLLTPITMLMGGTLTLLTRHLVRKQLDLAGWRIALLYGVNTLGAAAGCFLTDFALIPVAGLRAAQVVAVLLNLVAAAGALWLAWREPTTVRLKVELPNKSYVRSGFSRTSSDARALVATSAALALSGFAAMGMEILWFRHFTLLLGGFRAVFSLLLTIILIGMGVGSLLGGVLVRRTSRPAGWLMVVQSLFVGFTLLGLANADLDGIMAAGALAGTLSADAAARIVAELAFNARPILLEVGVPALLMGFAFPLANVIVQRAELSVGRRAGVLYLSNTSGAVCGSLATGFLLLPGLGMQRSATVLAIAAAGAVVPLYLAASVGPHDKRRVMPLVGSLLTSGAALWIWLMLPPGHLLTRTQVKLRADERLLTMSEGVNETIAVTEVPGRGRGLITNGHPMSSTALLDQRYMRALAHIPLLSIERPDTVLIIGFGVGNTAHAATRHPSIRRVEVADLSRQVLDHAGYFKGANGGVLNDQRIVVYINDGRQHLQMQPTGSYDLITLEPPPIAHAGVAALYSREFYALARSRLKPGGYLSQWLPAYQVPAETSLAMVRAFIDVFPQSVLLSGMRDELLIVGATGATIEIDPERVATALKRAPDVAADLSRLDLGTVTEIVGTFVGSADTLARATRKSPAVSDDRPLQEYAVRSVIASGLRGVPASMFDLSKVGAWCPRCFDDNRPTPAVAGLDTYLALLDQAYRAPGADVAAVASAPPGRRRILGSAYLGAVVPDTDAVHNVIGVTLLRAGRYGEAADAFREALKRRADSADANRNLGTALAESGQAAEATDYLRRAVQLDPGDGGAQHALGSLLLERREFAEAADHFRAALRAMPDSAGAHNDLGIALASLGQISEAIEHFRQAVTLEPEFEEGRRNLASALKARRHTGS